MYPAMVPSGSSGPARPMSTEEPSSSRTSLRECRTRSLSVSTLMPGVTRAAQDGTSVRPPVSTTHTRHTPSGARVPAWQSVGMSMPRARHASRIVEPCGTVTDAPSMVTSTAGASGTGGGVGRTGERAGAWVKMTVSTPV